MGNLYDLTDDAQMTGTPNDFDDVDFDQPPACPACGGEAFLLGTLGALDHFRCRACGWTFAVKEEA